MPFDPGLWAMRVSPVVFVMSALACGSSTVLTASKAPFPVRVGPERTVVTDAQSRSTAEELEWSLGQKQKSAVDPERSSAARAFEWSSEEVLGAELKGCAGCWIWIESVEIYLRDTAESLENRITVRAKKVPQPRDQTAEKAAR